jgi:CRISPR/Cas system CSM-associated protein Csm2 small subunit
MENYKSIIKCDSNNSNFYEMQNRQWVFKRDIDKKWWWIWSKVEYTMKYDEWKGRNIIDKIISVEKWKAMIWFWDNYLEEIEWKTLAEKLSIDCFEKLKVNFNDKNMKSNSALRKVFDSYLKILDKKEFDVEKEILFAKIWYQEQRDLFPKGFTEFLREMYKNLWSDKKSFHKFLEVFVAYHKYFNPNAK